MYAARRLRSYAQPISALGHDNLHGIVRQQIAAEIMGKLSDAVRRYFATTPKEVIKQHWEELSAYNSAGVDVLDILPTKPSMNKPALNGIIIDGAVYLTAERGCLYCHVAHICEQRNADFCNGFPQPNYEKDVCFRFSPEQTEKTERRMKTIRVFEAFAGYGSQAMALKRLQRDFPDNVKFEFVGISEVEPYAIAAYNAVHGDTPNFGDISKIDWAQVPDFDLFTYSFPCQDISTAGKQKGFIEGSGSRSSLLWECRRAIEAKRPKFLLMENVKALVQKKFMPEFQRWIDTLANLGYTSFWQVLNAKDFGVPQNRERVFMVSILGEATFEFPKPFPLEKRLRDVLEENVDEQYYLSDAQTQRILAHCERKVAEGCGFKPNFQDEGGGMRNDNNHV